MAKSLNELTPDELATLLGGSNGEGGYYTPSFNSNESGSFERNYNNLLSGLNPQELLSRYSQSNPTQGMFNQTGMDQSGYQAYTNAKSILGRDINAQELAQIMPAFQGPNGLVNGRAFLANMAQQEQSNPQNPNSPYNPNNPKNSLTQYNQPVAQQFQSILGRAPTQDELQHFSGLIASNQLDQYGLGNFLKQMPEYTNQQDKQFRSGLANELTGYDTEFFNRAKQGVVSQFMQNGTGGSTALDSALTDLMGQIQSQRGQYLANLSSQQYGGNKDLAVGNYKSGLDQMYNNSQSNRGQQSQYGQQLLDQGFQGADYQTQMKDYLNFMKNNQGKSSNPLYGAVGGLVGAGIGGFAGGPAGVGVGYQIGSGAGNSLAYLGGR